MVQSQHQDDSELAGGKEAADETPKETDVSRGVSQRAKRLAKDRMKRLEQDRMRRQEGDR